MLIHFGVKPYVVFDGDYLPSKEHTEKERAERRRESKRVGLELLRTDRLAQAQLELQKAVDVTPVMARELIEELKRLEVPYVVAPYEADSQLAYLEKQGIISGILSEDSDLLVFGAKCLLTKLDQYGECVMINRADFTACREVSLVGWTDKEFRMMAMLSGCDYLPGIEKMGLKTAYRLVRKHKVIDRVVRTVQFDGKMKVPAGYLESFTRAERTFLYQWVYCSASQRLVNLNQIPSDMDLADMPYIGKSVEPNLAVGVAAGDLDPNTKEKIVIATRHQQVSGRERLVQTPDEKQGMSITEFFKPRRTPLAELDPNSFTPSPSQQRLLEAQQRAAWSASVLPTARRPTLNRAASGSTPVSAPQITKRVVSNQSASKRQSPKRQRLCSESMLAAPMEGTVGLQTATSRFFSKNETQPSPSLRKRSGQKKQEEFDLWFDDSVAEIAATMTAAQELKQAVPAPSPKKRKKLAIFTDPEPAASASPDVSQETTATTATNSYAGINKETPSTSFEESESASAATVFSKGIETSFANLKAKRAFQPSTPKAGASRRQSAPLSVRTPQQQKERDDVLGRLAAPVQQLPETTCDLLAPEATECIVPASSPIAIEQQESTIQDEEWLAMETRLASDTGPQGSEDLLVPDSPTSDAGDDGRRRSKLDLGRFAFAGR